jgi:hypothetical protein
MKIYIWTYLEGVTNNYHDGGGVVIITNRDPQEVWDDCREKPRADFWGDCPELELPEADIVYTVDATEEKIIVFPDTGCC